MTDRGADIPEELSEKLDDFEFQYGSQAGKLALAMDLISDAEIASGMLAVYCRNGLDPSRPRPDVEQLQNTVRTVRTLVKAAFREERARRTAGNGR